RSGGHANLGSVFAERARDAHQVAAVLRRHPFELDLVAGLEARLAPAASAQDRRRGGLGRPLLFLAICGYHVKLQDRVRVAEAKFGDRAADRDALLDLVEDRRRVVRECRARSEDEHAENTQTQDHAHLPQWPAAHATTSKSSGTCRNTFVIGPSARVT